jgi:hypothetical protein
MRKCIDLFDDDFAFAMCDQMSCDQMLCVKSSATLVGHDIIPYRLCRNGAVVYDRIGLRPLPSLSGHEKRRNPLN